jgi:hypothetical protein
MLDERLSRLSFRGVTVHEQQRQADAGSLAQHARLSGDDVQERVPVPRLHQRLRLAQTHGRRQAAVELDHGHGPERFAGIRGGQVVEGEHIVGRLELSSRQEPGFARRQPLVGGAERPNRLLVLTGGAHLFLSGAQSVRHPRHYSHDERRLAIAN